MELRDWLVADLLMLARQLLEHLRIQIVNLEVLLNEFELIANEGGVLLDELAQHFPRLLVEDRCEDQEKRPHDRPPDAKVLQTHLWGALRNAEFEAHMNALVLEVKERVVGGAEALVFFAARFGVLVLDQLLDLVTKEHFELLHVDEEVAREEAFAHAFFGLDNDGKNMRAWWLVGGLRPLFDAVFFSVPVIELLAIFSR